MKIDVYIEGIRDDKSYSHRAGIGDGISKKVDEYIEGTGDVPTFRPINVQVLDLKFSIIFVL
jgi:hypothetical protein